jgi:hypothetical protein
MQVPAEYHVNVLIVPHRHSGQSLYEFEILLSCVMIPSNVYRRDQLGSVADTSGAQLKL